MRELVVSKQDLRVVHFVDVKPPELTDGVVRLRLDHFALTSNNMTYAVMGGGFAGYWDYFPTAAANSGRPPAWGFATVIASRTVGIEEGARYYGFFPISETLDVMPVKASPRGFIDGAPHRAAKSVVYNHYLDTRADPAYDAAFEAEQTLVRPLYSSGWWTADRLHQVQPRTVVMSSASSKTAIATAHRLRQWGGASVVALTSARHESYVAGTGLYDRTHVYGDLTGLSAESPAVYVDFLGREELTAAVHQRLGATLQRSIHVGATDWTAQPGGLHQPRHAPQATPAEMLFVPEYAASRLHADRELASEMLRDLRNFYGASRAFFVPRREAGEAAILAAWAQLAAAEAPPQEGLVLSF